MKLYYSPGACSLAPHIVLHEANIDFELVRVNLKSKLTDSGLTLDKINQKNYIPILEIGDGIYITEVIVILQYLADLKPAIQLIPAIGSIGRIRQQEWLSFINSEIHKNFYPLFHPASDDWRKYARDNISKRLLWVDYQLEGKSYLMGENLSVADCYLFTILRWCKPVMIDISNMPNLLNFIEIIKRRPAVQATLKAEGLLNDILN